jgi:hypothetical protein
VLEATKEISTLNYDILTKADRSFPHSLQAERQIRGPPLPFTSFPVHATLQNQVQRANFSIQVTLRALPFVAQSILVAKSKVFPVHTMKAYRGNRGISPFILNLGIRWR